MIKFGICFCQPGVMSQCNPAGHNNTLCDFYIKHSYANRCSHHNPDLNDHCWSQEAQQFGYYLPDTMAEPEYELVGEVELSNMIVEERTCANCILFMCSFILNANKQAQSRHGLTAQDFITAASNCAEYDDDETMKAKVNQSIRGILP